MILLVGNNYFACIFVGVDEKVISVLKYINRRMNQSGLLNPGKEE